MLLLVLVRRVLMVLVLVLLALVRLARDHRQAGQVAQVAARLGITGQRRSSGRNHTAGVELPGLGNFRNTLNRELPALWQRTSRSGASSSADWLR